ncbi:auxin-responsive protein IAA26-like [Senna tora]|uniref:Auxin-induced protein n=1 Tax=Senna tora TaxID=362788 RepID=A0A835CIC5_9FABA|nr:auxin-responsive protein IAA26-like [Senna tora]
MDVRSRNEDERKLELRLGPPGADDWSSLNHNNKTKIANPSDDSLLSLSYFPQSPSPWPSSSSSNSKTPSSFMAHNAENTAVPNTSQKRTAPGPVVGWPPIRSFRKNLASSSNNNNNNTNSKTAHETQQHHQNQRGVVVADKVAGKKAVVDNVGTKGLFVKINMDGVPIGRKVDLKAYDSYQKLSSAVDELFRCLLAAQRDSCGGGIQKKEEEEKAITISGLLDGSGEYTLVYEDNEGDRMLVGDVPWQ